MKTMIINLKYFGLKGVIMPVIICGKNTRLSQLGGTVKVQNKTPGMIRIGIGHNGVVDSKSNRCTWENNGVICFSGKCNLVAGTSIVNSGELVIGDGVAFNGNVKIICHDKIHIGNHVFVSWDCMIMDTDYHHIYELSHGKRINEDSPVFIGDNVWIGMGTTLLKGCCVPDNCVVAARSLVTKTLKETNCIYVSNDIVKRNINWE